MSKQDIINAIWGKLSDNTKYSPEIEEYLKTFADAKQRQDVANGLNGGNKEILAKQIELGINKPTNQEQIDLARAGKFNLPTEGATRQGGLINGYNQGYNLNYDNPTNQISTRIGQALGTAKRGFDSPLGRAIVAYGASRMMGDNNPMKQAATAYQTRQNANTANQLYRQQLGKMGIDTSKIGGDISTDMYKTWVTGYNAGAKTITLQELANLGDERAINAINNGANPYTTVNNSIGKDLLNRVGDKNSAMIDWYGAKTESEKQLLPYRIKEIDARIAQNQQRINLYAQQVKNGTASNSVKAELDKLKVENMQLAIEKKRAEVEILKQYTNNPDGNPLPVTNVPINNGTQAGATSHRTNAF